LILLASIEDVLDPAVLAVPFDRPDIFEMVETVDDIDSLLAFLFK